ncbi:hypothetical protein VaNZ11_001803, partial [Volvox africanus]
MADGEGNKPALSLLEEQEQHKGPSDAPEQTPAPYVQPYRPSPAIPPVAQQSNLSATGGAEGSIRSRLSNASYSYARGPGRLNSIISPQRSGSAGGADTSVNILAGAVGDVLPSGTLNNTHLAHLLAYTQQQLIQLQQIQTLLMQHLQSQGPSAGAVSPAASGAAHKALPSAADTAIAAGTLGTTNQAIYAPTAGPLTQIPPLKKPFSTAAGPTPAGAALADPALRPAVFNTMGPLAPESYPIPGSGAAAEQLSLVPSQSSSSLATTWPPPQPPSHVWTPLKEQSSVGSIARREGPLPTYPGGAAATAGSWLPVHHQESQVRQMHGQGTLLRVAVAQSMDPATAEQQQQQMQQVRLSQQAQMPPPQPPSSQQQQQQTPQQHVPTAHSAQLAVAPEPDGSMGGAPPTPSLFSAGLAYVGSDAPNAPSALAAAGGTADTFTPSSSILAHTIATSIHYVAGGSRGGDSYVTTAATATAPPQTNPPTGLQGGTRESQQSIALASPRLAQREGAQPSADGLSGGIPLAGEEMQPLAVMSLSVGLLPPSPPSPEPPSLVQRPALTPAAVPPPALSAMPSSEAPLVHPGSGASMGVQLPLPLPAAGGPLFPILPEGKFFTAGKTEEPMARAEDAAARGEPWASTGEAAAAAAAEQPRGKGVLDRNRDESVEFEGPELDAQLDANRKDLLVFPEEDEDGEDSEGVEIKKTPWYKRTDLRWFAGSAFAATVLAVTGICMQLGKFNQAALKAEIFRWLYLVAGYVPIYWGIYFLISRLFMLIEWVYFRENLTYLKNIKETSASLISMLLELLWFMACFVWLWCEKDRCSSSLYHDARDATWRVVLCIMLFTLANLIKVVTAKIFSMHFYRTAHFKKLKDSLEKEYYLQLLSVPRSRILAQITETQAEAEAAREGGARYQIKTVMERRSLFHTVIPLQRLGRITALVHAISGGGVNASESSKGGGAGDRAGGGASSSIHGNGGVGGGGGVVEGPASAGHGLARSSKAPVQRGTWAGFWQCGARGGTGGAESEGELMHQRARWLGRSQLSAVGGGDGGGIPSNRSVNELTEASTVSAAQGRGGGGAGGGGCGVLGGEVGGSGNTTMDVNGR